MKSLDNIKGFSFIKVKEDMLAPMDAGTSGPGELYQTPLSMTSDMDTFSLVGPGKKTTKKKKKPKKKEKTAIPGSRVLTFNDFLKGRK